MRVYLTASISQKKEFGKYYEKINETIKKMGHRIYSGNLFKKGSYKDEMQDQDARMQWYKASLKEIGAADVVVAEMSYPSTANVGHEVSVALEKGKPVIALYKRERNPVFLQGLLDERLILVSYTDGDLESVLKDALKDATDQVDIRFTMLLSSKIVSFLNKVSRKKNIPRSVFIRNLIEKEMGREE